MGVCVRLANAVLHGIMFHMLKQIQYKFSCVSVHLYMVM